MKKLLLMIAAVAMLTACNGNGNTSGSAAASGEATDSAATEQTTAADAGAAVENDYFKITKIPNGWEKDAELESERRIDIKLKPGTDLGEWQHVEVEHEDFQDVKEWLDQVLVGSETTRKLADDVTIGDKTYKQVQWINSADVNCALIGKTTKGVIQIKLTEKLTLDNPDVKAIIEGIEYKN